MKDNRETENTRNKIKAEKFKNKSWGKMDIDWAVGRMAEIVDEVSRGKTEESMFLAFVNSLAEVGYSALVIQKELDRLGKGNIEFDNAKAVSERADLYLKDLGINWEMLKGKSVLDIGANGGGFATEAKNHNVDIVSLDDFAVQGVPRGVPYVISDAGHLPFKDKTLDLVVARAVMPIIAKDSDKVKNVLEEVERVLKVGGEFRFGPVRTDQEHPFLDFAWDKVNPNIKRVIRNDEWAYFKLVKHG